MKAARWGVYALLIIALFTIAVHVKLWFSGIEDSAVATIYRTRVKTVYVEVERDKKAEKGLERITLPCRQVQVLVEETAPPRSTTQAGHPAQPPLDLLGIFRLPPLPSGGSARVTLDESGETSLEVKAKAERLLELGKIRELGAWYGTRLDNSSLRTWSLSYSQDIFRVGPAWLRGRVEYGDEGFGSHGKAELGIAVRF